MFYLPTTDHPTGDFQGSGHRLMHVRLATATFFRMLLPDQCVEHAARGIGRGGGADRRQRGRAAIVYQI